MSSFQLATASEIMDDTLDETSKGGLRKRIPSPQKQGYVKLELEAPKDDKPWYQDIGEDFFKWAISKNKSLNIAYIVRELRDVLKDDKDDNEAFRIYAESHFSITDKKHLEYLRFLCEIEKGKEKEISGWSFS
ncbi:MAG: hypothetical protein IBJ00_07450 [Alphaproteobacteria bacterium]|nr:hypothetical protein [Alphaproteobacteria bacterium]